MFDDPKKDLKWLEQQLLAQEDPQNQDQEEDLLSEEDWLEVELREARALLDNGAPRQRRREDAFAFLEEDIQNEGAAVYADDPRQTPAPRGKKKKKEKGVGGLVFLACMETLGIIAVMLWWVIWLL